MLKLNNCPFCGGKAYIFKSTVFMNECYYVKCSVCGCQTIKSFVGFTLITKRTVSSNEAAFEAVKDWNGTNAV